MHKFQIVDEAKDTAKNNAEVDPGFTFTPPNAGKFTVDVQIKSIPVKDLLSRFPSFSAIDSNEKKYNSRWDLIKFFSMRLQISFLGARYREFLHQHRFHCLNDGNEDEFSCMTMNINFIRHTVNSTHY